MKLDKPRKLVLLGILAATGLAVTSVTIEAGATGATTMYYACLAPAGTLSHVGTTKPTTTACKAPSKVISWNSVGPAGPAGAVGPAGPGSPQLSKTEIATQQWWKDPARGADYTVGSIPLGLTFRTCEDGFASPTQR